jgi:hypothetical protein
MKSSAATYKGAESASGFAGGKFLGNKPMRIGLLLLLIVALNASTVTADPIRYDQIPSDASSYIHVDLDRLAASSFVGKSPGLPQDVSKVWEAELGIRVASITFYTLGESKLVALLHGDDKVRQNWEGKAADEKDAILFSYDNQAVHYLPENPWISDSVAAAVGARRHTARLKPERPAVEPAAGVEIGFAAGDPEEIQHLMNGPLFVAFVGEDFVVATTDLPTMAHALDALNGKRPSLAKQDPKGLKADPPPGAILQGAGFTAGINANNVDQQENQSGGATGGGLDLFGSFKGKTRLAQCDIGQDENDLYFNAKIMTTDAESAEQLKNLMIGVKALISLSKSDKKPLIDPFEIHGVGNNVVLHWKWPTTKLSELIRLSQSESHDAKPLPVTDPAEPKPSTLPPTAQ